MSKIPDDLTQADVVRTNVAQTDRTHDAPTRVSGDLPLIEARGVGLRYRTSLPTKLVSRSRSKKVPKRDARFEGDDFWAIRNVDLTWHRGQIVGIIGTNGAGKSTLCSVLSGILLPDEGELTVRGSVGALLSLGAGINRELSGRDNIILSGILLGLSRQQVLAKLDTIIEFSELEDYIDRPIRTYSSGMRSRLSFAVTTCIERDILFLDEVLSVGDSAFKLKCQRRIEEMMDSSNLVAIVSHSIEFLKKLATHMLWMDKGSVKMFGPTDEVLDIYAEFSQKQSQSNINHI